MPNENILARVAKAVASCMASTSTALGGDCLLHARFAQFLLRQQGIESRLCIGEAAWRVGPGDGDVIVHCYRMGGFAPPDVTALPFHAWLDVGGRIFDCTTHSLGVKAKMLDRLNGGHTHVDWAPQFLCFDPAATQTFDQVAQAPTSGVCFYKEDAALYAKIQPVIDRNPLEEEDLLVLRMVYGNPNAVLVGPNDVATVMQVVMAA